MGGVISSHFQLVLGVPSKLISNTIDKGLGVSKIFSEESLEIRPCDWSGAFVATLLLGPFEADGSTEEYGSKRGTIHPYGT